jgi:hypothetical protein
VSTLRSPPILVGLVFADQPSALEVIGTVVAFAGAIGLGVAVFVWMRNWRRRLAEEAAPEEPIETYQQMLDEGLIEAEEFERIAARLREKPNDSAAGDSPAAPPAAGPPSD